MILISKYIYKFKIWNIIFHVLIIFLLSNVLFPFAFILPFIYPKHNTSAAKYICVRLNLYRWIVNRCLLGRWNRVDIPYLVPHIAHLRCRGWFVAPFCRVFGRLACIHVVVPLTGCRTLLKVKGWSRVDFFTNFNSNRVVWDVM